MALISFKSQVLELQLKCLIPTNIYQIKAILINSLVGKILEYSENIT